MEDLVRRNKGKVQSSLSRNSNFLVYGEFLEDGRKAMDGKKFQKAKMIGTQMFDETQFENWLKRRFRNPLYLLGRKVEQIIEPDDESSQELEVVKGDSPSKSSSKTETSSNNEAFEQENSNNLWTAKYMPRSK